MSVNSKLFVTCGKERLFDVMQVVIETLNVYSREKLDSYWKEHTDAVNRLHFLTHEDYKAQAEIFSNGTNTWCYDFDVISVNFGCGDENKRTLNVFPDCSCDNEEVYSGDKIKFSIGHWGYHEEIMQLVGSRLKYFGEVYYDHNDCDDEDFVKL